MFAMDHFLSELIQESLRFTRSNKKMNLFIHEAREVIMQSAGVDRNRKLIHRIMNALAVQ